MARFSFVDGDGVERVVSSDNIGAARLAVKRYVFDQTESYGAAEVAIRTVAPLAGHDLIPEAEVNTDEAPNPVVRRTPLRAYPGWVVREYRDGMYDAAQVVGVGITPGCDTFAEAVDFVRRDYARAVS